MFLGLFKNSPIKFTNEMGSSFNTYKKQMPNFIDLIKGISSKGDLVFLPVQYVKDSSTGL